MMLYSVTLKRIDFVGLIHISPVVAMEVIGLQEGDSIDIEKVNQSIIKFYKQGYFKDIYVTEEDGILTYHFKELPTIANIQLDGYDANIEDFEVEDMVGLKKGDIYNQKKIEQARRNIIEFIEAEGKFDTVVEEKIEELNENSVAVIFEVNEGEEIIIKEIEFCGAEEFDAGDFESVTANREEEWLGWMWGFNDGKLRLNDLEFDAPRIKDMYMKEGYLDATVSNPFLQTDFNTFDAKVTYHISEGEPYTIESIHFEMAEQVVSEEELREDLKSRVGRTFNIDKLRRDIQNVQKVIKNKGYAFAVVNPDLSKNKEEKTVAVTYLVIPGKKAYINDVLISGNTRTLDRVVRREVLLAPGDLYNLTDLTDSKNALKRRGYFEKVEIEEKRISEDKLDLLVKVEEAMTGEFRVGAGYGSFGGLSFSLGLQDRNVFGSGVSAGIDLDVSQRTSEYTLSVNNPRVLDSEYSLGAELFRNEYDFLDYDEEQIGGRITGGKFFERHLQGTLSYEYSISELTNVADDFDTTYVRLGDTVKSALTPGVNYNDTNDFLLPTEGKIITSFVEFAGIGGDDKYTKNLNTFNYYYGLEDEYDTDIILRYKARAGFAIDHGYLPISRKFYLGGISKVRGYSSNSVSPRDDEDNRIGGKQTFVNSVEASALFLEQARMRLAVFYDYGMLGEDTITELTRSSVGVAVEWISPLGPINVIMPFPLDEEEGDRTSSFEFAMGKRF